VNVANAQFEFLRQRTRDGEGVPMTYSIAEALALLETAEGITRQGGQLLIHWPDGRLVPLGEFSS
jgi:hypothetical protein